MDPRRLGDAMLVLGAVVLVVGLVLTFTDRGDDGGDQPAAATTAPSSPAGSEAPAPATEPSPTPPSPAASPTPAPTAATTPSPTVEAMEDFYADFDAALAGQDVEFLYARLAPPVLDRYGTDQCRTYLQSLPPQDLDLRVVDVAEPAPWEYATDEVVTTVPDVVTVTLERTVDGETTEFEAHVARVDGLVHWFTDCGDPL